MAIEVVRLKGGVQIQFNDGRVGFVRVKDVEDLAHKLLKVINRP